MTKRFSIAHPCFRSYSVRLNHSVVSKPPTRLGYFMAHAFHKSVNTGLEGATHSLAWGASHFSPSESKARRRMLIHAKGLAAWKQNLPCLVFLTHAQGSALCCILPLLCCLTLCGGHNRNISVMTLSLSVSNRKSVIKRSDTTRKLSLVVKMIIFNIQ